MKKVLAKGIVYLTVLFTPVLVLAQWGSSYTAQFNAIQNEAVKNIKSAERNCSASYFNLTICKRSCNKLGKSQRPSSCKNADNPPVINQITTNTGLSLKKNVQIDFLSKLKNQWRSQRQDLLAGLKQEKADLINKFKEKFTAERCARVQKRIQNRLSLFADAKEKHTSVYTNLVNRINKFIARADEQKLDTTVIKSHLAELQDKIEKFKNDYAAYAAKLGETKNYTCGHSEGEFKGVLLESKTLLKQVHTDAADIRTYVRETILVDLKALKAQMTDEEE